MNCTYKKNGLNFLKNNSICCCIFRDFPRILIKGRIEISIHHLVIVSSIIACGRERVCVWVSVGGWWIHIAWILPSLVLSLEGFPDWEHTRKLREPLSLSLTLYRQTDYLSESQKIKPTRDPFSRHYYCNNNSYWYN